MATKPDVRVRLSAEGISEVVEALKRIADEANKQGQRSKNAFKGLIDSFGGVRGLISKLSVALGGIGFASLGKEALEYADSIGKAAQKTGAATETLSVLRLGASTADVEVEALDKSLVKLAVNMEELRQGTQQQIDAFAALGLKQADIEKMDTGQVFVEIAKRLGSVQDGYRKTTIATELFGKSGAQLIPLLNDLSEDGFDRLAERAEHLGLVVSEETALLAANVNDSFTDVKNQLRGLALNFVQGLLPSVKQTMDGFKAETEGKGVKSAAKFGQEVGRVLRIVVRMFQLFETAVGTVLKSVGNALGGIAAAVVQGVQGNFSEAGTILKETFNDTVDIVKDGIQEASGELKKLVEEANKAEIEVEVTARAPAGVFVDVETDAERKAREKREKDAERERQKREREEAALERKREQARERLFDVETKLLESEGRRHEAFERNLQKETEEIKKLMETLEIAADERDAFLQRFQDSQRAAFNLEELKSQFDSAMDELDAARERIQRNAEAGLITQFEAEMQIRKLEEERIPILERINAELQKQAGALGPDAVKDVQKYNESLEELQITQKASTEFMTQFKNAALEAGQQGLADMLKNIDKFKSAGDALKSVFRSIVSSLQELLAEIIAKQLMMSLIKSVGGQVPGFKDGGLAGYAEGGQVGGSGTGTSDSNLAWLSRGEFVVRAAVVSQPGMLAFLSALNGRRSVASPGNMPRFAAGGLNNPRGDKSSAEGGGLRIVNVLDPNLVTSALGSPGSEKVIMNMIQRNASSVRRYIGDAG